MTAASPKASDWVSCLSRVSINHFESKKNFLRKYTIKVSQALIPTVEINTDRNLTEPQPSTSSQLPGDTYFQDGDREQFNPKMKTRVRDRANASNSVYPRPWSDKEYHEDSDETNTETQPKIPYHQVRFAYRGNDGRFKKKPRSDGNM